MIKLDLDNINLLDVISSDIENNLDYYYDEYCKIYKSNIATDYIFQFDSLLLFFNFKLGKKYQSYFENINEYNKPILFLKMNNRLTISLFLKDILQQNFKNKDYFHKYIIKKIHESKQELFSTNNFSYYVNLQDIFNLKGNWNIFEFLNKSQIIKLIKKIENDIANSETLLKKEEIFSNFLKKFYYRNILNCEERKEILPPIFLEISNLINTYVEQTNFIPKGYEEYIKMIMKYDEKEIDRFVFLQNILLTKNTRLICETLDIYIDHQCSVNKIKNIIEELQFDNHYFNITGFGNYSYQLNKFNLNYYDKNNNILNPNKLLRIDDIKDSQVYNNKYIQTKINFYNKLLEMNIEELTEDFISEIKEYIEKLKNKNKDNFIEIK